MTTQARDVTSVGVLVVCADRNFQRYARAVLVQGGHQVFITAMSAVDVAVQVRLRSPQVVVLDVDHQHADNVRVAFGRIVVVEVSDEPEATGGATVGKWDGGPALLDAVERAAVAARRRSMLYLVRP